MSRSVGSTFCIAQARVLIVLLFLLELFRPGSVKSDTFLPEDSIRIQAMVDTLIPNRRSDVDWAMAMVDSIISESKETGFLRGLLNGYNQKGHVYWDLGDFITSREYYQRALPWADSINSPRGKAIVLNNLGSAERMLGNYSEALENHLEAREIFELIGDVRGLATAINNAAIIYKVLEDDSTAIREYKIAAALSNRKGQSQGYSAAYINISIIFQEHNQLDSARWYLEKIFELDSAKLPPIRVCQAQSALATNYSLAKEYDSALVYIQRSQKTAEQVSGRYLKLTLKIKEGNIRRFLGQRGRARKILNEVLETAREMKAPEIEKSALEVLIQMDEKDRDYKGAYQKYRAQMEIQDSILGAEQQQQMAMLRNQYQVERQDRELAELNLKLAEESEALQEKELDLEKSWNRIGLLVALALLLLLVLGFIAYRLWENARRTRLLKEKQELTERSLKEKEVLVGEIHHRVKNNLQVIYNILDLQSRTLDPGAGKDALQESMLRISTMALVHNELYKEDDLTGVRMEEYLPRLANHINNSFGGSTGPVEVEVKVSEGLTLSLDSAIPIGMLINELITNSLKHAFDGEKAGEIGVRLAEEEEELELEVWDNGQGKKDLGGAGSFGTRLIRSLVRQLKGKIEESVEHGTRTLITIKNYKALK